MTGAQRRASEPGASVWVSASAGTGKTKVLTDRVLRLLLSGAPADSILCLTFTRAAAAEMALRVSARLARWAVADDSALAEDLTALIGATPDAAMRENARRLFALVLDVPGGMRIETIHAFCQSLLRRFPLEAGVAPHFDIADERMSFEFLGAAANALLRRAQPGVDDPLAAAFGTITTLISEFEFGDLLNETSAQRPRLQMLLERHHGAAGLGAAIRKTLGVAAGRTVSDVLEEACVDEALDRAGLAAAAAVLASGTASDRERSAAIGSWLGADLASRVTTFGDYWQAFWTKGGKPRARLATKGLIAAHPSIAPVLDAEQRRLGQVLDECNAVGVAESTDALLKVAEHFLELYDAEKQRHAALDFDDQIEITRRLLAAPEVAPWVLFKLDNGLDHLLIDEAQDTSPAQWAVVAALVAEFFAGEGARDTPRTLFVVGDEKQSIFSFQGADPRALDGMQRHFRKRVAGAGKRWEPVPLEVSFRSGKAVLDAVDAVFAHPAARQGVVSEDAPIRHLVHRKGQGGRVELWQPTEPVEPESDAPWSPPVARRPVDDPEGRLALIIARRIKWWTSSPSPRESGAWLESRDRRIRPGDVMVLVRRRTQFVDSLVRALKTLDVPVAGIDRMVVTEQLAVMDLIALGEMVLLPGDDLTLATVLKSPLVGLDEEQLFDLAAGRGRTSLWRTLSLRRSEAPAYAAAHERLSALLGLADTMPPFEFFTEVLGARGGRAALLARLGPEAADPIDEFLALALSHERTHPPSLSGFLSWIKSGRAEIARDLEQGRDEVRIMTVHGAKGLQAPVVFLPDTIQKPTETARLLWLERAVADAPPEIDGVLWPVRKGRDDPTSSAARARIRIEQEAEYRRLLYVAMTRAEDRLYVCGWRGRNKPPADCWHELVRHGLERLPDVVPFVDQGGVSGVRYAVPQTAPPEDAAATALRQDELVLLPAEFRTMAAPEPEPPRPLAPSRPADEPPVRAPLGPSGANALARGRLVHRLLELLPALAPETRADAAREFLARHGMAAADRDALAHDLAALMATPDVAPLFGAEGLAEASIGAVVGEHVISGQIDRLLVRDGEVIALDYKTGRAPPDAVAAVPPAYLDQMARYAAALAAVFPGRKIRCGLLFTDAPRLMWLPQEVLAARSP